MAHDNSYISKLINIEADTNPNVKKLKELEETNVLKFPGDQNSYNFNSGEFYYHYTICSTQKVVVECHTHTPTCRRMAVKFLRISDATQENSIDYITKEVEIHRVVLGSPYVVDFYGLCVLGDHALICMELMDTPLYSFYKNVHENANIEELTCLIEHVTVSIVGAMYVCKDQNIIHRDIKPQNILVKEEGAIKLADFGVSQILKNSLATTYAGTIIYWPPERFDLENITKYGIEADIWSLGITLAEIAKGQCPILCTQHSSIGDVQEIIRKKPAEIIILESFQGFDEEVKQFARSCLKPMQERPKLDELIDMPFFQRSLKSVFKNSLTSKLKFEAYIPKVKFINFTNKITANLLQVNQRILYFPESIEVESVQKICVLILMLQLTPDEYGLFEEWRNRGCKDHHSFFTSNRSVEYVSTIGREGRISIIVKNIKSTTNFCS